MNLADYKKFAAMSFGECDGIVDSTGECRACRIQDLIEKVWTSGQRSGAHNHTARNEGKELWSDSYWGQSEMNDLMIYGSKRGASSEFVAEVFEQVKLWAEANEAKKVWLPFVKAWLSRELKKNPPPVVQQDLFGSTNTSPSSSRDQKRAAVTLSLVGAKGF